MRRATLIVNPEAGRAGTLAAQMPAITALLRGHGYAVESLTTTSAEGSARDLALGAAQQGSTLVLACGGDGTIHSVVQGLAQTNVVLGVVPLGTANALARSLKLPLDLLAAVARLMSYEARLVPLGEVRSASETRWFCLMAGCGPAGSLAHTLAGGSKLKARFSRIAYYLHAARLFLTRHWPTFRVRYQTSSGDWHSTEAVALMASWVPSLGGLLSGITFRASVLEQSLHVQIVRGPAWLSFPAWMIFGARGPWVREVPLQRLRCDAVPGRPVYAQADAEPMGTLPIDLRIVPDALWMLLPPTHSSR